jgi:hypothetical protein
VFAVAVFKAGLCVEAAGLAGDALRDDAGVLVDQDGHFICSILGLLGFGVRAQLWRWPINDRTERSRRWGALRSEIKEEAAGRGTFAEQGTPSA